LDIKQKNIKERILIIHPEGNIFNNPNLYSICKYLSHYYLLDILIPKLSINDDISFTESTINIIEYNALFTEKKLCSNKSYTELFIDSYFSGDYSLVIGVDRLGLILAYLISKLHHVTYAFISYEITFVQENQKNYKSFEIIASKDVSFVIVQDTERAQQLSYENHIPLSKMVLIPVASCYTHSYVKSDYLYNRLKINRDKKILLFIGSISSWSCVNLILDGIHLFPDDWVVVFHDRYNKTKENLQKLYQHQICHLKNVYFSNCKINKTENMHQIIHSADLGLSLYCPDYKTKLTGKNLEHIGLASGKTATYLQNGLPVIITKNNVLSKYIKQYKIGFEIENLGNIISVLQKFKIGDLNKNCINFFDDVLSFNNYKDKLLEHIQLSINNFSKPTVSVAKNKKQELLKNIDDNRDLYTDKNLNFSVLFNNFYNFINQLKNTEFKYIIYGNGTVGKTIHHIMQEKIVAFIDRNSANLNNSNVYHPSQLKELSYDKIIISVLGREDIIKNYLISDMGIDNKQIVSIII
jgi:hypothetical protein